MLKARFVAIAVLACCLPAYGAMGPLAGNPQDADVAVGSFDQNDAPAGAIDMPKEPHAHAGKTPNRPLNIREGDLRDTGACDPAIGLDEPVPCTINADCAGLGKAGQQPGTCGTNGFCEYPDPTPCPNGIEDCQIPDEDGVYIGTGHCVWYDGGDCTTNSDCKPGEICEPGTPTGTCEGGYYCEDQNFHACRDPGFTDEGEWTLDGAQGYTGGGCGIPEDMYNGGCNVPLDPHGYHSPIACGETVCGTAAKFEYSGNSLRDTDWYQIQITEPTLLTMHATAEFDMVMGMARNHGNWDCTEYDFYYWGGHYEAVEACVKATASACVGVGTWWIAVVPQWDPQPAIPCLDYELSLECDSPCHVACCIGNNVCIETDDDTCEFTLWPSGFTGGINPGDCEPGLCAWGCPGEELECNGFYERDNSVNMEVMNPSPSCGSGQNVGVLWFNFVATEYDSVRISTCNSVGTASDSVFALYSGDCLNTLEEIGCAEDPQNCEDPDSWLGELDVGGLVIGGTYYIQLASWDPGTRGAHDLDILCPSPAHKPAACCLSDGSCLMLTPTQCDAIPPHGGQYQGPDTECLGDADTNGIDDACEIGACCTTDIGCVPTSEDWCYNQLDGVDFIPGASCPAQPGDYDPCAGACCWWKPTPPPPGAGHWECDEMPSKICAGNWYPMEECGGPGGVPPWFDCPDPVVCELHPEQDANCQEPSEDGVEGSAGAFSDEDPWIAGDVLAQRAADDFIPLVSGINEVCWWGHYVDLDENSANTWAPECNPAVDLFTVSYYADNNGCPGAFVAQYTQKGGTPTLAVVKTIAGWRNPNDHLVYEYEGTHAALTVAIGECYWLEIVNDTAAAGSCAWAWDPAPYAEGNGYSVQELGLPGSTAEWDCDPYDPGATQQNRFDLAWCLNVANTPCNFCRPLAAGDPEGEGPCFDEYVDTYNAGCNLCDPVGSACHTEAFTDIACGQLIRGTAGTYEGHPPCDTAADCDPLEECIGGKCTGDTNDYRDTDWYKFELTEITDVDWCVYAEFPALTGMIQTWGVHNCPPNPGWSGLAVKAKCIDYCADATLGVGTWYGYVATTAFVGAQCGAEYEVCLSCNGGGCVQGCEAVDARSIKLHGATEFSLDMGISGGIEPRVGLITKLEIDLDSAASVSVDDTASVNCTTAWSGSATVTAVVGDTVTVEFSPALTGNATCVITLDCMTRLSEVSVSNIEGDLNLDGLCNPTDFSSVKLRFGQTVVNGNCEWDFNHDGVINPTDASSVKLRFGNTAP